MAQEVKIRWSRAAGIAVARELSSELAPLCMRLVVAGSLRRRKPDVGDVEILFIPRLVPAPGQTDLFTVPMVSAVDLFLAQLEAAGCLRKRLNKEGDATWGPLNKFAWVPIPPACTQWIPVDFFTASEGNWWHQLVCRTGPAESNTTIATRALRKGWHWHPYGVGFTDRDGRVVPCDSEQAVFACVSMPYREPWDR